MDDAYQQPVTPDVIDAMCRRAFGEHVRVVDVGEIGVGTYNSTYKLELEGLDPVILRVAPGRARQVGFDRDAMRNEYAAAPFLATLGTLVPRILTADFTGQIIERDYMFQAVLPGVPASALAEYPVAYYRQLGSITRAIHDVRGERFGKVAGPTFATWSEALAHHFGSVAEDYETVGLDPGEVRRIAAAVSTHRATLDEITTPGLLHGDLWHLNIMVDPDDSTIVGVLDYDAAMWGDPMADWTMFQVRQRPGAEAFWETYGPVATSPIRNTFYQARSVIGARFDIHRRGIDLATVPPAYWDLTGILAELEAPHRS